MRRLFKILAVSVLAGLVATPAAAGVLKNEIIMICTFEDEIRTLKWKDVIFSKNTILEWADIDTRRPIKDPPLWVEWCPALQPSLGKPVEPSRLFGSQDRSWIKVSDFPGYSGFITLHVE